MTNPINRALTAFDEFIAAWLGPAAQRFVFTSGNTHADLLDFADDELPDTLLGGVTHNVSLGLTEREVIGQQSQEES